VTVEYAAIWRAKQLAERDMRVIRFRLGLRRIGERMGGLGVSAAAAAMGFGGFRHAVQAAMVKQHEDMKRKLQERIDDIQRQLDAQTTAQQLHGPVER